jgi:hypothetical protein
LTLLSTLLSHDRGGLPGLVLIVVTAAYDLCLLLSERAVVHLDVWAKDR